MHSCYIYVYNLLWILVSNENIVPVNVTLSAPGGQEGYESCYSRGGWSEELE